MNELNWKRKEYESWDEAFGALAPTVRQQSVRVASYTQVLFVEACAASFGKKMPEGAEQMNGKYADLAYKCGMYHQLGKALVPQEYQIWQKDFTEEEKAVYRKYTSDGRLLVAALQERTLRAKERRTGKEEAVTDNVTWLMIREACQQHMERWDGSGYPDGRIGDAISPIAQIVGLAKELDRLASQTKSENPFAEAYDALIGESGKAFSPELIDVLKNARAKCRAVYNKYIHYTMTLPKTIPLVKKSKNRPMGLSWYPMVSAEKITAYEAKPWFGGVAGSPDVKESIGEIEEQLKRLGLVGDMTMYFLYEAADALLRIENCKLSLDALVVDVIPSFYTEESQLAKLIQLYKDQPVDRSRLIMTVPEALLLSANEETTEVIRRYLKNGFPLMVDGWHPERYPLEKLKEMGFAYVRPDPALLLKKEMAALLTVLPSNGITVYACGVDNKDAMLWLAACGVTHMIGTITGHAVDEDGLIRDSLLGERIDG